MDLDTVADELYGLAPEEFTSARTAQEKQARAAGDRDLASAIHQLAKPNTVAWLANQLVRAHRDQIEPLLELGAGLREATATLSGEQLRTLGRQRHQLIYALVQLARGIAGQAGRKVSDDTTRGLEATLNAALADESAAEELLAGRLTGSIERSGFTPADRSDAPDTPPTSRSVPTAGRPNVASLADHRAAQRQQAERDVQRAQDDVAEAAAAGDSAQAAADQAERAAETARDRVEQLRAELDEAINAQTQADEHRRGTRAVAERAQRSADQARRRLEDAKARRAKLS